MANKKYLNELDALAKACIEILKALSAKGHAVTTRALSNALSEREEVIKLFKYPASEPEKKPCLNIEEEVERLRKRIDSKEAERQRFQKMVLETEVQCNSEVDYHKRFALAVLGIMGARGDEIYSDFIDEYRDILTENANLVRREQALRSLKNLILKYDISPEGDINRNHSFLKGIFKKDARDIAEGRFKQLKKASLNTLSDLEKILGNKYHPELMEIQSRVSASDDFDYLLSQRKYVLTIIEKLIRDVQTELEALTAFIREIIEKLSALERIIDATTENTDRNHKADYTFTENLESQIKNLTESFGEVDSVENLKSLFASKLNHISSAIRDKRNEFSLRIETACNEREVLKKNFETIITSITEKNQVLEEQSRIDPLTEIFNRRVFEDRIDMELERFQRYKQPFTLIFFDVDHFKNINDTCGHDAGDKVLKTIAMRVREILRKPDVFARYGGEEFVIILPETDLTQGKIVADKLRYEIENTVFEYEDHRVPVTISIGVTGARDTDRQHSAIIHRADSLLYTAKREGRNRVVSDIDTEQDA
ncbi:GGDEF domain-containing protein [bacterium]|nr:GGDEF domain-containing protein [bacterium]